jgi:hypothetical protein
MFRTRKGVIPGNFNDKLRRPLAGFNPIRRYR